MRIAIMAATAAVFVMGAGQAHAARNPFEIKPGKYNKGMVIVAIDDAPAVPAGSKPVDPAYDLTVAWFDTVQKKPHLELHWVSSPNAAEFRTVSDDQGHRYLVGAIGEGEALIMSYSVQSNWSICYNAETYHFYVKANTYNFIGRFDQKPSRWAIEQAVMTGKMPMSVQQNSYVVPLVDRKLEGFTPGQDLAEDKQRIEALAASNLGHAVEIVTPVLTATNYNLSKNLYGQTSCAFWSGKGDRPDRSTPDSSPDSGPQKDEPASPTEPVQ